MPSWAKSSSWAFDLALKELGNKIGGIPVEVFKEDAGMTPASALQATTRLVEKDHIDFLVGQMLSNQLLAYVKPVTDSGAVIFSGVAGPSQLAGADCNPNLFVVSWENNTPSEAVGKYMTDSGVKRAFFISQNYVTGREYVAGAKAYFKGESVGEAYVPIEQVDYAAELAAINAANPDAVYAFLPGAGGIAFVKQFANSGMMGKVKLFSGSWLADEHSFPRSAMSRWASTSRPTGSPRSIIRRTTNSSRPSRRSMGAIPCSMRPSSMIR